MDRKEIVVFTITVLVTVITGLLIQAHYFNNQNPRTNLKDAEVVEMNDRVIVVQVEEGTRLFDLKPHIKQHVENGGKLRVVQTPTELKLERR